MVQMTVNGSSIKFRSPRLSSSSALSLVRRMVMGALMASRVPCWFILNLWKNSTGREWLGDCCCWMYCVLR